MKFDRRTHPMKSVMNSPNPDMLPPPASKERSQFIMNRRKQSAAQSPVSSHFAQRLPEIRQEYMNGPPRNLPPPIPSNSFHSRVSSRGGNPGAYAHMYNASPQYPYYQQYDRGYEAEPSLIPADVESVPYAEPLPRTYSESNPMYRYRSPSPAPEMIRPTGHQTQYSNYSVSSAAPQAAPVIAPQFYPPPRMPSSMLSAPTLLLETLEIGRFLGRAGSLIVFMLVFHIKHSERIVPREEIQSRKKYLTKKCGALLPQWPVLHVSDAMTLIEPTAILRYLASRWNLYGQGVDPIENYLADVIIDKVAYWRDHLSVLCGEGLESVDTTKKADSAELQLYFEDSREQYYLMFESILEYRRSPFFLGHTMSWVDPAVFSVIYDDIQLHHQTKEDCERDCNESDWTFPHRVSESGGMLRKFEKLYNFYRGCMKESGELAAMMQQCYKHWWVKGRRDELVSTVDTNNG